MRVNNSKKLGKIRDRTINNKKMWKSKTRVEKEDQIVKKSEQNKIGY